MNAKKTRKRPSKPRARRRKTQTEQPALDPRLLLWELIGRQEGASILWHATHFLASVRHTPSGYEWVWRLGINDQLVRSGWAPLEEIAKTSIQVSVQRHYAELVRQAEALRAILPEGSG